MTATARNDYSCNVFTHDDGCLPTFPMRVNKEIYNIDSIDFSPATVPKALTFCKLASDACDPDDFTSPVVKKLMYSLVNPPCMSG